jgi:hypothetical protein
VRKLLFIFFLLALPTLLHCQETINSNATQDPQALSLAFKIYAQIEVNASTPEEAQQYVKDHSAIVIGHSSDMTERMLVDNLKISNPTLSNAKELNDTKAAMADILSGKYVLVMLIGGPSQNNVSEYAKSHGWFNESQDFYGELTVESGKHDKVVYVMISDKKGYTPSIERQNVKSSPLSAYIPEQYVPVAATGITLILLALVNVIKTVMEFKSLEFGRKGKKLGEAPMKVMGVDLAEIAAILGASVVLGLSITWQYFGNSDAFLYWITVNSIIALVGALLHELTHRVFAHIFKIKIEYRFWPEGSILTLVSSYLGNAFSVQAFLLEEIPADVAKWKVGLMKLAAPVVSAMVMVIFAFMNHFNPSPIFQMIYSTSALWAMAEMLPFSGLDGKDIKDWNSTIWTIFFALIGAAYIIVTFLL